VALLQVFPGHHFTGMFEQNCQQLKGLLGKPDAEPPLAQFSSTQVRFVNAKAHHV